MGFSKDFAWGVATASYQVEGGWNEDGKGLSIWDVFTHEPGIVEDGSNGDVACDHYHLFREDVRLMAEMGIKAYRFSLSWARIFPDGIGRINEKGVQFYSDIIDELLENGIEPYVTLFHWDLPYELHKKGGWLNSECVNWFAEYASKVTELFSDRVKYFITFNEPQVFIGEGYLQGFYAPGGFVTYRDIFQMAHNVMKAHGAAVKAMRKAALRDIQIGYAPTGSSHYPVSDKPEDIAAARELMFACPPLSRECLWNVSWWSDPVLLGRYPEDGLELYKEYLPEITPEDMELICQPLDFYGQNIYNGKAIYADEAGKPAVFERPLGASRSGVQWPITPECLQWGPRFLYERYKLPIYITENGMAAHDTVSLDGKVHDPNRIDFTERYLLELEKASDSGADVKGYFHWTFMDNLEWTRGYTARFGMVYVDYQTQKRIIKDSGYWYKKWIAEHS